MLRARLNSFRCDAIVFRMKDMLIVADLEMISLLKLFTRSPKELRRGAEIILTKEKRIRCEHK
jgi:hypothetical protein